MAGALIILTWEPPITPAVIYINKTCTRQNNVNKYIMAALVAKQIRQNYQQKKEEEVNK